jgi:Spy/CpxP family protein refolding chaperone
MKRAIGITVLGLAIGGAAVAAQPAGERSREGRRGPRGQAVVEYLGLTEQQQDSWKALRDQHRDEMKALREEGRAVRQRLQESLEADEPDAVVGEAAKAAHAHRQMMKEARETFEGQLKAVLSPEQQEKYEAFKAARAVGRKGHGTRGPRGGRPGRGAPPVEG